MANKHLSGLGLEILLKQRDALATFGEFALLQGDLQATLQRACELVADACSPCLSKVLEISADGKRALVRAGVGWPSSVVGQVEVPVDIDNAAGYALAQAAPVISNDVATESRFTYSDFLIENGIKALVNVPILLPGERPWGILEVDSRTPAKFSDADVSFLRSYATLLAGAIRRRKIEERLAAEAEQKEILFEELQHRINNDLAVVASLIGLQRRKAKQEDVRDLFEVVERRVGVMHLLYNSLHIRTDRRRTETELCSYLKKLTHDIAEFKGGADFELSMNCEELYLSMDTAIPIGLIVNEFVTNSQKHAKVDGRRLEIAIRMTQQSDCVCIVLEDNGPGMLVGAADANGSGLELVRMLSEQLGAEMSLRSQPSVRLSLEIPLQGG